MANINKASTEDDKHAVADIPMPLPGIIASCAHSSHNFFFSGSFLCNDDADDYVTIPNSPEGCTFRILQLDLNNPFNFIYGMQVNSGPNAGTIGFQTNPLAIFHRFDNPYYPQGINQYKEKYLYYKVESVEVSIIFRDLTSLDGEQPFIPYRIHTYLQNNEANPPGSVIANSGVTATQRGQIAALMMHPRVGVICGGQPMGPTGTGGYSGITSETYTCPYAPELHTSLKWVNSSSVASDPANTSNIQYWTLTGGTGLPGPPANIQRLHFFGVPHTPTLFTATGQFGAKARPTFTLQAKFNITWRDSTTGSAQFTSPNYRPST